MINIKLKIILYSFFVLTATISSCNVTTRSKYIALVPQDISNGRVEHLIKRQVDTILTYDIKHSIGSPYDLSYVLFNGNNGDKYIQEFSSVDSALYAGNNFLKYYFRQRTKFMKEMSVAPMADFKYFPYRVLKVYIKEKLFEDFIVSELDLKKFNPDRSNLIKLVYNLDSYLLKNAIDMNVIVGGPVLNKVITPKKE